MRKIKRIKINVDKCSGCGSCELACSSFHAQEKHGRINPARSRIRVYFDQNNDLYIPVIGNAYTAAECHARSIYTINEKEYSACGLCGVACPSRDLFKEPDSGLPLKCDTCLQEPPLDEPLCVTWCIADALTYEEVEEEGEEEKHTDKIVYAMDYLRKEYGWQKIKDTYERLLKSKS